MKKLLLAFARLRGYTTNEAGKIDPKRLAVIIMVGIAALVLIAVSVRFIAAYAGIIFALIVGGLCFYYEAHNRKPAPIWGAPEPAVVRNAIFIILTEQPKGVYPIIKPLSPTGLPMQLVNYRGIRAWQLCVDKSNVPVTPEDAEAFRLRLNSAIKRHLIEGSFPGVLRSSEDNIHPLFQVDKAYDRGIYWDLFIVPGTLGSGKSVVLPKADDRDNDF